MNPALRILHVITGIDRGGAENHLWDLIRGQLAAGHTIVVAYLKGHGYWAARLRGSGVEVHALALRFYGDPGPVFRLRRIIAEGGFDLVHAHLPPAELYARLALLGTSAAALPLVISKHNDCAFHRLPGERALGRWVAARAAAVIAISEAVQRYMIEVAGLASGKVETILYGIDVQPFARAAPEAVADLRKAWGAEEKTMVIGFVGRLVEQKSIGTLIAAFALFARDSGQETRLVIVGDGPLERMLRHEAETAGVARQVVWAGFHEDIPEVMHAFDVFALTSVHEGFGLVLVEAMAAKRPVVATRAGAIAEVVIDGECGLLAESRNPRSVASALLKLTDPAVRARMGAAGHRRVFEHFTLERMRQATEALYARVLQRPPRPGQISKQPAATLS